MFTPGNSGGRKPKPKPKPAEESIPNDIVAFVAPPPPPASTSSNTGGISLPPPPVRPLASTPSNTGGWSLPPPPRRDPRPDVSQSGRSVDDSDSDRMRPGRIVEELQDQRPEYSDGYAQAIEDAYKDENGIYFQLYMNQGTVRKNDFAESGLDEESDWHAAQRAYRSIDRYMNGSLQHGQEKSAADGDYADEPYTVRNSGFNRPTEAHLEEHLPHVETPEDFIEYVKTELPKLIPEYANNKINWDSLTYEEAAMFYYAALEAGALEYRDNPRLYNLGNPEQVDQKLALIGAEKTLIGELMRKMAIVTPLEDLDALLAEYGWVDENHDLNVAHAQVYFHLRVKAVYEHLGRELPSNWEEINNDPLIMANMLADIYSESGEEVSEEFFHELAQVRSISEEYGLLTGEEEPFNPLPLAADILSWLYPPFGIALTVAKIYHSGVVQGDLGAAAEHAAGLAIPRLPRMLSAGSRLVSSVPQLTGTANALAALSESSELAFALDMRGLYKDVTGLGEAIVPDTPETLMANMDTILAEIQTQGVNLNEIPEGMPLHEWYTLIGLLEGSEHMTQTDLVHVIQMGFRATLRENRQYPHEGSQ